MILLLLLMMMIIFVCVFMSCDFILIFSAFRCAFFCVIVLICLAFLSSQLCLVLFLDQSALRLLLCSVEKGRSERGSTFLWLLQRIVVISFSDAVF
jgi:hypothetical protein